MANIYKTAYFKDKFVPFDQANLSIASSPMLYGLSIYTVMPVYLNHKTKELNMFRFRDHYKRLVDSAKILSFNDFIDSWDEDRLLDVVKKLIKKNNIKDDALVRITVFVDALLAGTKMTGLPHKVAIFVYDSQPVLPEGGVKLMVSNWRRTSDKAIPARAKVTGSYVNSSLMKNEALNLGFDDAIALDDSGHVAESSVSNILIVRHGQLISPDANNDILEGITLSTVAKIAASLNIPFEFATINPAELFVADEAFLSGSSVAVTPILSIDNKTLSGGKPGKITSQIRDIYQKTVHGHVADSYNWLTKV